MTGPDSSGSGAEGSGAEGSEAEGSVARGSSAQPKRRPTPPGTWPVVVSLGLLVIVAPVTVAIPAFPRVLAILVAVAFAGAGVWALATSFVLLWREWGKDWGVPIIGCVLGAILVTVVLAVTVPLAFAG